ncbi:hypothetical protein WJX77_007253 [Trebouxia sp. C0004]
MLVGSRQLQLLARAGRAPDICPVHRSPLSKRSTADPRCIPLARASNFVGPATRQEDTVLQPAHFTSRGQHAATNYVVKNIAGIGYAGLLAFWLFKVLGRRVKRGTTERLASERDQDVEADEVPADTAVTAGAAALGALQAGFFTYLLFLFSTSISTYFGRQELPDQYTAKNITVTIRTAVGGLSYLATFIFGANALGLTGLALKLAFFPDDVSSSSKDMGKQSKDDSLL